MGHLLRSSWRRRKRRAADAEATAGLLDGVSATIKACYSTYSRLKASYTGPLFRLIRASDSAESDFGFATGTDVLDVAAVTAWIGASSAKGVTWYDQSGNGFDLTQATDSARPPYAASGINSKPSFDFDGSNDYLKRTTGLYTTYPCVVYVVTLLDTKTNNRTVWSSSDEAVGTDIRRVAYATGTGRAHAQEDDTSSGSAQGTLDCTGAVRMTEARFLADNDRTICVDGTNSASNTTDVGNHPGGLDHVMVGIRTTAAPGFTAPFDGDVSEVVELSTAPSNADRNIIGNAFEATRGYTWSDVS